MGRSGRWCSQGSLQTGGRSRRWRGCPTYEFAVPERLCVLGYDESDGTPQGTCDREGCFASQVVEDWWSLPLSADEARSSKIRKGLKRGASKNETTTLRHLHERHWQGFE